MFYKDDREVYRVSELDRLEWLVHGFGTRHSDIPALFDNLATVKQIHSAICVAAEGRCGVLELMAPVMDELPAGNFMASSNEESDVSCPSLMEPKLFAIMSDLLAEGWYIS